MLDIQSVSIYIIFYKYSSSKCKQSVTLFTLIADLSSTLNNNIRLNAKMLAEPQYAVNERTFYSIKYSFQSTHRDSELAA